MLYVLGYPADCGGANVELFATVKLWRAHGVEITLIPTWSANQQWRKRLDELGCETLITSNKRIELPDDSTVVSFGNYHLLDVAKRLQNCRLIYVPCVSAPTKGDVKFHKSGGEFGEYVFQSCYQAMEWAGMLEPLANSTLIPGAFDPADFPFNPRPHKPGEPFWCGRISRPDKLKFSPQLWDAYRSVPNIRARIMGWSGTVQKHCGGDVPCWATVLTKRTEAARDFYGHLHAIIHPSGQVSENWPRFVLEAMASGVPVITDDRGGICEMIEHGETGFLCDTPKQMAKVAAGLAKNEKQRLEIAKAARAAVEKSSTPEPIWAKWEPLLKGC